MVRVVIGGRVFGAESTAKLKVIEFTCSGVIETTEVVGTPMSRVRVLPALKSNILHFWRPVLVQVNMSRSPGQTDVTIEGVSVKLPAIILV